MKKLIILIGLMSTILAQAHALTACGIVTMEQGKYFFIDNKNVNWCGITKADVGSYVCVQGEVDVFGNNRPVFDSSTCERLED